MVKVVASKCYVYCGYIRWDNLDVCGYAYSDSSRLGCERENGHFVYVVTNSHADCDCVGLITMVAEDLRVNFIPLD